LVKVEKKQVETKLLLKIQKTSSLKNQLIPLPSDYNFVRKNESKQIHFLCNLFEKELTLSQSTSNFKNKNLFKVNITDTIKLDSILSKDLKKSDVFDVNSRYSFVLGVLGIFFLFIPFSLGSMFIMEMIALIAIILGLIGLLRTTKDKLRGKGLAIAGLILGIFSALFAFYLMHLFKSENLNVH
jgi:hypothetical protein